MPIDLPTPRFSPPSAPSRSPAWPLSRAPLPGSPRSRAPRRKPPGPSTLPSALSSALPRALPRALPAALPAALLGTLLLAGGCAALSPPPPEPTLSVEDARRALPAEPVEVRWGGTITEVRNTAEGTTVLEVVSRPLRRGGRPIRDDRTDGRFLAEVDGFLDPEIVKAGRDVTVSGRLEALREGRIGESDYRFPVVAVSDYRYWKVRPRTVPVHFPHPYPLGSAHHHPFWHGWPHRPYHRDRRSGVSVGGTVRLR